MTEEQSQSTMSRRKLLSAAGTGIAAAVAGCQDGGEGENQVFFSDLQESTAKTRTANAFDEVESAYAHADSGRSTVQETGLSLDINKYDIDAEDGNGGQLLTDNVALGIAFTEDEGEDPEDRSYPGDTIERADTGLEYVHQGGTVNTLTSSSDYESALSDLGEEDDFNMSADAQNVASAIADEVSNTVGVFWAEEDDGEDNFNPRLTEDDLEELEDKRDQLESAAIEYANSIDDLESALSTIDESKDDLDVFDIETELEGTSEGVISADEGSAEAQTLDNNHFTSGEATDYLEGSGDYSDLSNLTSGSSVPDRVSEEVQEMNDQYGTGLTGVHQALQNERTSLASEAAITIQNYNIINQIVEQAEQVDSLDDEQDDVGEGYQDSVPESCSDFDPDTYAEGIEDVSSDELQYREGMDAEGDPRLQIFDSDGGYLGSDDQVCE